MKLCSNRFNSGVSGLARLALTWVIAWTLLPQSVGAHIGDQNVILEANAGSYPVRVVIRPPGVIPGLAEISVRVLEGEVERVTALPIRWNTGKQGAPPPDVAEPIPGEANLFGAQLWFMTSGAYAVEIEVKGDRGSGVVQVPFDALATRTLKMSRGMGGLLAVLGGLLFLLSVSIHGAAMRESTLEHGAQPSRIRLWASRGFQLLTAIVLGYLVIGGKRWWDSEDSHYRNNRLYEPIPIEAKVISSGRQPMLRLEILDERFLGKSPLVPDHGKLMHLFLIREPSLDVFAHLHPVRRTMERFESILPALDSGQYQIYADVTQETGLNLTFTNLVEMPSVLLENGPSVTSDLDADPDDSWCNVEPSGDSSCRLSNEFTMVWLLEGPPKANQVADLRFAVKDSGGELAVLEPYMGMLSHMVIRKKDGSVFTHLHPSGSVSMASMKLFELRASGKAPWDVGRGDPLCELPSVGESQEEWLAMNRPGPDHSVAFPYSFPTPGEYRMWVQVKIDGQVLTGVFDALVGE